ncbi:hypothetical protein Cgig2_027398 [Carnegiea gigantea]|uniref:Uncharacterized protein n=1 Tax=Carnegiea gigantea TaxID=171969 RepID=A0A9Q1K5G0_9CARY|nr:hypothetical protein Cgig2_027398 [Carnegiea gigantea]
MDRVFVNTYWFDHLDFSQVNYMANSLLDHTPMVIDFPGCPKPPRTFQFCDMWIRDSSFLSLVRSKFPERPNRDPYLRLQSFLSKTKAILQQLNRCKFANLRSQQIKARNELKKIQSLLLEDHRNNELNKARQIALAMGMNVQSISLPKQNKGKQPHMYLNYKMNKAIRSKVLKKRQLHNHGKDTDSGSTDALCAPFTEKELKITMFSISNKKITRARWIQ